YAIYMGVVGSEMCIRDSSTYNAARVLNISDRYGIEVGKPANLIVLNGKNFYQVLNEHSEVLYSIHKGKVIAKTIPKKKEILF
ncbi:amidohydrolase family protein, partial [Lactobacillus iners]|uniref:amidohydrolase family protein n=1 Tax=Lactobacillus iners TaxID=147802 RepID=UPI001F08C338